MMVVRKLRLEKGWSQEQLAGICDLSVRTIQRIERGQKPSLESLKSLASVFEIDVTDLTNEAGMNNQSMAVGEQRSFDHVRDLRGFYTHLVIYAIVVSGLFALNLIRPSGHFWALGPALGWGIGVLSHGLKVYHVFSLFGADREKRQIKKRLRRSA